MFVIRLDRINLPSWFFFKLNCYYLLFLFFILFLLLEKDTLPSSYKNNLNQSVSLFNFHPFLVFIDKNDNA